MSSVTSRWSVTSRFDVMAVLTFYACGDITDVFMLCLSWHSSCWRHGCVGWSLVTSPTTSLSRWRKACNDVTSLWLSYLCRHVFWRHSCGYVTSFRRHACFCRSHYVTMTSRTVSWRSFSIFLSLNNNRKIK